uniref:Uncharacterized protein n=1 Tax=Anguilla anguilla TaxID=7936 RepID=A0A0E9QS76_ANGAN
MENKVSRKDCTETSTFLFLL